MKTTYAKSSRGFTIVELLIVIVVIAILATISIVAYNGISERSRDSQRLQDIASVSKALELYYVDNGVFPNGSCGSACPSPKKIGGAWATTSDGSWSVLEDALVPEYLSELPSDPNASTANDAAVYGGSSYDYARWTGCTSGSGYILVYTLEGQSQKRDVVGQCLSGSPASYGLASERVVIK